MFLFVIAGLVGLVWVAHKAKPPSMDALNSGVPGPDNNIPALGATDKFSPAVTGGTDMVGRQNRLRASTNSGIVDTRTRRIVMPRPTPGTQAGIFGGLTNANYTNDASHDSDGGYKREESPRVVRQVAPVPAVQRFKL